MKKLVIMLTLIMLVTSSVWVSATFLQDNGRNYTALSADTKPTSSVLVGSRCYETDTGRTFVFNGTSWEVLNLTVDAPPDTLTAEGGTTPVATAGYDEAVFPIEISGADGDTVTVAIEIKIGTFGWTSIIRTSLTDVSADTYDLVYSATDSTYVIGVTGISKGDSLRAYVVDLEDAINFITAPRLYNTTK